MSDTIPDYMSRIEAVAIGLYEQTSELGAEIMMAWRDLEKTFEPHKYDVLAEMRPDSLLRQKIRGLIRILYRVPNSYAAIDVAQLREKNADYGGSWCRRGGPGAFMMLARKADRLEEQLKKHQTLDYALKKDDLSESLLDTLGDLRRYLILCEAWHVARETPTVSEQIADQIAEQMCLCTRPGCGHAEKIHEKKQIGEPRSTFMRGACLSVGCECSGYAEQLKLPVQQLPPRLKIELCETRMPGHHSEECVRRKGHDGACSASSSDLGK